LASGSDTTAYQRTADYWSQKVLAVSSVNAAMQNYVSIHEHQARPNPALAAVHGQAALLLRYDVPTYYVSRELLAAAARTELPDDMVFEAISFPLDALVFMLPKGTVRHPTDGDCPFHVLSRASKGQNLSLLDPGTGLSTYSRPGHRAGDYVHAGSGVATRMSL